MVVRIEALPEEQPQIPFDSAQGRHSASLRMTKQSKDNYKGNRRFPFGFAQRGLSIHEWRSRGSGGVVGLALEEFEEGRHGGGDPFVFVP
jgi:hypothetical protein